MYTDSLMQSSPTISRRAVVKSAVAILALATAPAISSYSVADTIKDLENLGYLPRAFVQDGKIVGLTMIFPHGRNLGSKDAPCWAHWDYLTRNEAARIEMSGYLFRAGKANLFV